MTSCESEVNEKPVLTNSTNYEWWSKREQRCVTNRTFSLNLDETLVIDKFKILQESCKNLARNLARECIVLPFCLQDSCKNWIHLARFLQDYEFVLQDSWKILNAQLFLLPGSRRRLVEPKYEGWRQYSWYCVGKLSQVKLKNRLQDFSSMFWLVFFTLLLFSWLGKGSGGVTQNS